MRPDTAAPLFFCGKKCYNKNNYFEGGETIERKRNIRIKAWFHPCIRRLRHRSRECVEIPVYDRTVWRRGFCADLSGISGMYGTADPDQRVCSRTGEPPERGESHEHPGTKRFQFSQIPLDGHDRKLCSDDVLHHGRGMDHVLLLRDGSRQTERR